MTINKLSLGAIIPRSDGLKKKYEKMQAENKKRPNSDTSDYGTDNDKVKEKMSIISSITKEMAEKDYTGERIINKAHNGKQLDTEEEKYLAEKYPEIYQKYKSAQMEREALRQQMRNSKDKVAVAIAFSDSADKADKMSQDDWEREMRLNQLSDEYNEYKKTDEYKEKEDCVDPLGMYEDNKDKNKHIVNRLI